MSKHLYISRKKFHQGFIAVIITIFLFLSMTACALKASGSVGYPVVGVEQTVYPKITVSACVERMWLCDEYLTEKGVTLTAEEGKVLLLVDCSYQSPIKYDEIDCAVQGGSSKEEDMEAFYEEWSVSDDGESDWIRFVFQVDPEELKWRSLLDVNFRYGDETHTFTYAFLEKIEGLAQE